VSFVCFVSFFRPPYTCARARTHAHARAHGACLGKHTILQKHTLPGSRWGGRRAWRKSNWAGGRRPLIRPQDDRARRDIDRQSLVATPAEVGP